MPTSARGFLLAILSGAFLGLSFPQYGHPAFAWIALAPILVALGSAVSLRRAFLLGLTAASVYFSITLYWITRVMAVYGNLSLPVAVAVNLALIAYLALFPAIFAVVVRRLVMASGPRGLLAAPLVWVASELGRTYLFTGFPWVLLGYSQTTVLPVAQLASLFGVYGVSALVAMVSAALAFSVVSRSVVERRAVVACAGAILLFVVMWGGIRVSRGEWTRSGEAIRVAMVQGNVDQGEKWNAARAGAILDDYLLMTRQAIGSGAQLVLWPESSTPFYFEEDRAGAERVRTLAREARVPILFGSDQIERGTPTKYFNAAFLVREDGTTGAVYRKMHLVPFGEYVPLKRLLFFAAPLVEAVSDFSPGASASLLPIGNHLISTAICYEIVYPDLVRQFVRGGSELLTTITNDAWFGRTSAPYQHFAQASMRAIEEGRYLVRSANTGISGVVDPYGHVIASSGIYERHVVVSEARLLTALTLYTRIGDIFAYTSVIVTLALLLGARRRVQ